jgi:hypothetical protein
MMQIARCDRTHLSWRVHRGVTTEYEVDSPEALSDEDGRIREFLDDGENARF